MRSTTSRQTTEVERTLALSMEQTLPPRLRAASKATWLIRSISHSEYFMVSKPVRSFPSPSIPLGWAK